VTSRVVVSRLCARPNDVQLGGGGGAKKTILCPGKKSSFVVVSASISFLKQSSTG